MLEVNDAPVKDEILCGFARLALEIADRRQTQCFLLCDGYSMTGSWRQDTYSRKRGHSLPHLVPDFATGAVYQRRAVTTTGSSPRTWGITLILSSRPSGHRFTPTHVGKTVVLRQGRRKVSVHPHALGEYVRSDNGRPKSPADGRSCPQSVVLDVVSFLRGSARRQEILLDDVPESRLDIVCVHGDPSGSASYSIGPDGGCGLRIILRKRTLALANASTTPAWTGEGPGTLADEVTSDDGTQSVRKAIDKDATTGALRLPLT